MPYYIYQARDSNGKLIKGESYASTEREVLKILQQEDKLVLSIKVKPEVSKAAPAKLRKKVRFIDLVHFANELAILLENGVPIIDAFDIVLKQVDCLPLRVAIEAIKKDLEAGLSFRDAIDKHPKVFSEMWRDMIEAGEVSGQLPFVMRQIVKFLEFAENVRKKTASALMYPSMLVVASMITMGIFVFKIIPTFQDMFSGFNMELPRPTLVVIAISYGFRRYFIFVAIAVSAAVFLIKRGLRRPHIRNIFEKILFRIPVLGGFMLTVSVQKFAFTLSFLMKSGIPIAKALSVAIKAVGFQSLAEKLEEAKAKVMGGLSLSDALSQTELFSPLAVQLILVAEKTGNYAGMLEQISTYYDEIIDTFIGKFTTLLGPIILLFMGLLIGGMVIAMFLPMIKMTTMI
ncbi:MAG: type II secretion system F family protein [Candidatus Omnitrophota bacterium]